MELAEKYLKFAAECGLPSAMGFLGFLYGEGKDDDKFLEGVRWLCMSIIDGAIAFYKKLGDICKVESTNTLFNLHFAVYFREICDKEMHTAKENQFLGWCYFEGMCCIQNLDKAKMYWQAGEEQGSPYCGMLLKHEIFKNGNRSADQNDSGSYHENNSLEEKPVQQYTSTVEPEESEGLSIASLVIGIISICCCNIGILSVVGIVLGIIGRGRGGKGKATAGIVLNILAIVIFIIMIKNSL
ncbi:MAG: hypothetical protein NC548_28910 [Lachnospiraceae bacterium]|nr:hypothetical protein [Lachnospiraceae bacterium]